MSAEPGKVVHDLASLRTAVGAWRRAGERVALVPTMGALHEGHMALVRAGRRCAERVVLTIFVNPKQFTPTEDFAAYPRDLAADRARVVAAGGDLVYAPDIGTIYPDGFATTVGIAGPATVGLEDRFRPNHFAGVATIVAKLLIQVQADTALFGDKDFQQLRVVERLACDLDIATAIVGVPVVRDSDGLALSSRNAYLTAGQRQLAPHLHATLQRCAAGIGREGPRTVFLAEACNTLASVGFAVDYVEARDTATLLPLADDAREGRLLAAARLGGTRLIDNVPIRLERGAGG